MSDDLERFAFFSAESFTLFLSHFWLAAIKIWAQNAVVKDIFLKSVCDLWDSGDLDEQD